MSSEFSELLMGFDTSLLSPPPPAHTPTLKQESVMFTVTPMPENSSSSMARSITSCSNCSTTATSTWRKSKEGRPLCNACGLYLRVHGHSRPASWGRNGLVMTRTRSKKSKVKKVC